MIFLYRYFGGYLKVCFYGDFPEKILNLCADNGITLWGSKSVRNGITAFISIKDFYTIRYIIRGSAIRVHIEEKYGFPFIFTLYRKRWGIFVGGILFLVLLELMSGFTWIIVTQGNT